MSKTNQQELREQLLEICESLYQTGFNDGKNDIVYFPKPAGFRADQLLALFREREQELLERVEKEVIGNGDPQPVVLNTANKIHFRGREELRDQQRQKLAKMKEGK